MKAMETDNYLQVRELTDEEWLALQKEEVIKLYKNCYSMLLNYVKQEKEQTSTPYPVLCDICQSYVDMGKIKVDKQQGLDKEKLIELEEYLKALEEMVGIEPSAMQEIQDAILTANIMLDHPDLELRR